MEYKNGIKIFTLANREQEYDKHLFYNKTKNKLMV